MFGVGYLMLNVGDKVVFGVKLYKKNIFNVFYSFL